MTTSTQRFASWWRLLPWLVLLGGGALSIWIAVWAVKDRARRDAADFAQLTTNIEASIRQRVRAYAETLRAGGSFVAASGEVTRQSWAQFARGVDMATRYPGTRGVGVILPVREADGASFVARMQAQGLADFRIHGIKGAAPAPGEHFVITHVHPERENMRVIGMDIATEPLRREAAGEARRTGESVLTAPVQLAHDEGAQRAAFLLFWPVYSPDAPTETPEQRVTAFRGWVYTAFVLEEFLLTSIGDRKEKAYLSFFAGEGADPARLLFTSHPGELPRAFERVRTLELAERKFTVAWVRGPAFLPSPLSPLFWASGSTLFATLVLAGWAAMLGRSERRAERLAEERTQQLRESELRWRFALESSAQGLWDWDADRPEIYFSPTWKKLFCYENTSERELTDWHQRVHPEDLPAVLELLARHNAGEVPIFELEYRVRRGDGVYVWILDRSMILSRRTDGAPQRMIGTHTDISPRKTAELALRENERQLSTIYGAMADGLIVHRRDGVVISCNPAAERILGLAQDEMLGANLLDPRWQFLLPDGTTVPGTEHPTIRVLRSGRAERDVILGFTPPGGLPRWLSINAEPVCDSAGEIERVVVSFSDVTTRHRLQEELKAARDHALEASRLKSEFLANMSHEIRTPMNGVIGMTELLLETPLNTDQRELARVVQRSAESLLTIINDILDFSKIEAGKLQIDVTEFELRPLVDSTVALFAPRAAAKSLRLDAEIAPALPRWVRGDAVRVRQVLSNLTANAVKFTDHGSVRVVWREGDAGALRCEVHDTGVGIPTDQHEKLFQPFVQVDGSTTRRHGGTGLGLAISRQLVELMGGVIGFTSEAGRGSVFWFELPLPAVDRPASSGGSHSPLPIRTPMLPRHFLVAEDSDTNQLVIRSLLELLGHTCEIAPNGAEALRMLAAAEFDAVLMDCQMPVKDGFTTTREIRAGAVPGKENIPILALTAYAMPEDRERCLAAGMDEYLTKPLSIEQLRRGLEACVPGSVADGKSPAAAVAPVEPASEVVLNPAQLQPLSEIRGRTRARLLDELAELLLVAAPESLRELRAALAAGQISDVEMVAHRLAGSCAHLGAMRMRQLALELENAARQNPAADLEPALARVEAEWPRVRQALEELLR